MPVPITNQSPLGHHGRLSESKVFAGGHLVGEDHIIDLSVRGGHLVVKAGVSQGLLAPAAGERCLPPHKCVLDHQEGGVDLQSIQSHTLLFNHLSPWEDRERPHIWPAAFLILQSQGRRCQFPLQCKWVCGNCAHFSYGSQCLVLFKIHLPLVITPVYDNHSSFFCSIPPRVPTQHTVASVVFVTISCLLEHSSQLAAYHLNYLGKVGLV